MSAETATWVDGERSGHLPLPDRGLDFGDGLFETLLVWRGRCLYPELHWQRLQRGLQRLFFPDCLAQVQSCLQPALDFINHNQWIACALRLSVTRGGGPRGYAAPDDATPRIITRITRLPMSELTMSAPARLYTATIRWSDQPLLAGLKHLNRLEQVLAASEARAADCDEALMLNQAGQALSLSAGNLFVVSGDLLMTPSLTQCGIAGTRRRLVMERWAPARGLTVKEQALDTDLIERADEVFYSNSLQGLRPVASFGGRQWQQHPVCEVLYNHYLEENP